MRIKINSIKNAGDIDNERVVLVAVLADDIGHYLLFNTTRNDNGSVSTRLQYPFWLPDKEVSAGDLIVIYTKSGKDKDKQYSRSTTHFLYRGMEHPIWDGERQDPLLMDIRKWAPLRSDSADKDEDE
ncbi:hypothetical protein RDn1_156 [Candidatus Termititenax dinenymphae]|uniref:Uncharacterized protein n=1 Tax=Candidatus Termititenax dinenymphae TaxID=2218523 RepID=A0A388TJK2_9BACT|nr:hypothetical protein RDn1_156 [Candidatus Termititenax dinenymphae]